MSPCWPLSGCSSDRSPATAALLLHRCSERERETARPRRAALPSLPLPSFSPSPFLSRRSAHTPHHAHTHHNTHPQRATLHCLVLPPLERLLKFTHVGHDL